MKNPSHNIPIICCGCPDFDSQINKISKALSLDSEYPNYSTGNYCVQVDNICHLGSEWNTTAKIAEVLQQTTDIMEYDTNIKSIAIVNEFGIGDGLCSLMLKEIKDNFPELSILSVYLLPVGGISGPSILNSLVSAQAAMEISDFVMIREMDEARLFLSGGTFINQESSQTYSKSDINYHIASDVFVALSSETGPEQYRVGSGYLWPFNVCTTKSKLFDVRSSLWRFLKPSPKLKTKINPTRALSSNIHSLHLWHADADSFNITNNVVSASFHDLKIDQIKKRLIASPSTISSFAFATALNLATPKLSWSSSLGINSSRETITGDLINTVKRSNKTDVTDSDHIAISFDSPYAKICLKNICKKADALLAVKAFSHR
jgi:hypothetical protein